MIKYLLQEQAQPQPTQLLKTGWTLLSPQQESAHLFGKAKHLSQQHLVIVFLQFLQTKQAHT